MSKLLAGYANKQHELGFLSESKIENGKKKIFIRGPFQIFDEANQNGRIYPKSVLMPEIERYKRDYVDTGRGFGQLAHPEGPELEESRFAHRVVDLWVEGNVVWGKSLVLDTECGRTIKAMLEDGGVIGVSSRSLGGMDSNGIVNELHVICFDAVFEPSVQCALMEQINESKSWDIHTLKESTEKTRMINEVKNTSKKTINEDAFLNSFKGILKSFM